LHVNSPVDDTFGVEILQSEEHLTGVELCLTEGELLLLDVKHEIASTDVLHDKVNTGLGLEARMQAEQERMSFLSGREEDALLGLGAGIPRKMTKSGRDCFLL
jgi:hypothetical protein